MHVPWAGGLAAGYSHTPSQYDLNSSSYGRISLDQVEERYRVFSSVL